MRVLIADDSIVSRHLLEATLRKWNYESLGRARWKQAWSILEQDKPPTLAGAGLDDPGLTGLISAAWFESRTGPYTYIILLTQRTSRKTSS